jgi:hypothetical protein
VRARDFVSFNAEKSDVKILAKPLVQSMNSDFYFSALALLSVLCAFSLANRCLHRDTDFSNGNSMILGRPDRYFFCLAKKTLRAADKMRLWSLLLNKSHASRSVMSACPIVCFAKILAGPLSLTVIAIFCVVCDSTLF